ncbi:MAG TPA: hypothetical protein VN862_03410 [Candidatus Acidoferrales bacterium]|nr:hypothetical protein [Candidatus Acidoferrales bacterium]
MTDTRKGGAALIVGTVAGIITMSLHPTARDLLSSGENFGAVARLNAAVHALGIAAMPVFFLGALALSMYLRDANRLAIAGLVFYGFGAVAVMNAGVFSGFVAPSLANKLLGDPATSSAWHMLFSYTGSLNQAFAKVFVVAASVAIVLWSAAMLKSRRLSIPTGVYGCILGPVVVVAVAGGWLSLGVHGFGMVVLTQGIWFAATGVAMWRVP